MLYEKEEITYSNGEKERVLVTSFVFLRVIKSNQIIVIIVMDYCNKSFMTHSK